MTVRDELPEAVAAAFPFVPADLTIAHMASTYLPADVHCRFRRMLGHRAELISGIDVHSVQASLDGQTRAGMDDRVAHYEGVYRRQMRALNIELDVFERTDHPAHVHTAAAALSSLRKAGLVREGRRDVWCCLGCGAYPPVRMTLGAAHPGAPKAPGEQHPGRCPFCHGEHFERRSKSHLFLDLESHRARLKALNRCMNPPAAQAWVAQVLAHPLPDWNFTRDNRVGIPIDDRPEQSLYLWFESLLGYASMSRLAHRGRQSTLQFHGKNIIWHHSVLWPILLEQGLGGDASLTRNSIRGFLDVSHSDPQLLDIDSAVERYPVDYLRFYLVQSVPLGLSDFRVSRQELKQVCNAQLCRVLGNLVRRATVILGSRPEESRRIRPDAPLARHFCAQVVPAIERATEYGDVRAATRVAVEYGRMLGRMVQQERLYERSATEVAPRLAFGIASLLTILAPIMPELARSSSPFLGWVPATIFDIPSALDRPLNDHVPFWAPVAI